MIPQKINNCPICLLPLDSELRNYQLTKKRCSSYQRHFNYHYLSDAVILVYYDFGNHSLEIWEKSTIITIYHKDRASKTVIANEILIIDINDIDYIKNQIKLILAFQ